MKSLIFIVLIGGFFFNSSCTRSSKDYKGYACPMECEGKKIHEKPGQCSVCEMDLEGIEK